MFISFSSIWSGLSWNRTNSDPQNEELLGQFLHVRKVIKRRVGRMKRKPRLLVLSFKVSEKSYELSRAIESACSDTGIIVKVYNFGKVSDIVRNAGVLLEVEKLNKRMMYNGIFFLKPLPAKIDEKWIVERIGIEKDSSQSNPLFGQLLKKPDLKELVLPKAEILEKNENYFHFLSTLIVRNCFLLKLCCDDSSVHRFRARKHEEEECEGEEEEEELVEKDLGFSKKHGEVFRAMKTIEKVVSEIKFRDPNEEGRQTLFKEKFNLPSVKYPRIGFIGDTNAGKSSLINSLSGKDISPLGEAALTPLPLVIRHVQKREKFSLRVKFRTGGDYIHPNLSEENYIEQTNIVMHTVRKWKLGTKVKIGRIWRDKRKEKLSSLRLKKENIFSSLLSDDGTRSLSGMSLSEQEFEFENTKITSECVDENPPEVASKELWKRLNEQEYPKDAEEVILTADIGCLECVEMVDMQGFREEDSMKRRKRSKFEFVTENSHIKRLLETCSVIVFVLQTKLYGNGVLTRDECTLLNELIRRDPTVTKRLVFVGPHRDYFEEKRPGDVPVLLEGVPNAISNLLMEEELPFHFITNNKKLLETHPKRIREFNRLVECLRTRITINLEEMIFDMLRGIQQFLRIQYFPRDRKELISSLVYNLNESYGKFIRIMDTNGTEHLLEVVKQSLTVEYLLEKKVTEFYFSEITDGVDETDILKQRAIDEMKRWFVHTGNSRECSKIVNKIFLDFIRPTLQQYGDVFSDLGLDDERIWSTVDPNQVTVSWKDWIVAGVKKLGEAAKNIIGVVINIPGLNFEKKEDDDHKTLEDILREMFPQILEHLVDSVINLYKGYYIGILKSIEEILTSKALGADEFKFIEEKLLDLQFWLCGAHFNLKEEKLEFGRIIGRGSYGEVFKGKHDGEEVALKKYPVKENIGVVWMCDYHHRYDKGRLMQKKEAHYLLNMTHENLMSAYRPKEISRDYVDRPLVSCYYMDENDNIIMEGRKNLRFCLCSVLPLYSGNGELAYEIDDLVSRLKIGEGIIKGISKLHSSNIAHRDLKLENIFIEIKEEQDEEKKYVKKITEVKVGDYGFMKNLDGDETHSSNMGTPIYMDFRIKIGVSENVKSKYGVEVDIFSLGLVLLELWIKGKYVKKRGIIKWNRFYKLRRYYTDHPTWENPNYLFTSFLDLSSLRKESSKTGILMANLVNGCIRMKKRYDISTVHKKLKEIIDLENGVNDDEEEETEGEDENDGEKINATKIGKTASYITGELNVEEMKRRKKETLERIRREQEERIQKEEAEKERRKKEYKIHREPDFF